MTGRGIVGMLSALLSSSMFLSACAPAPMLSVGVGSGTLERPGAAGPVETDRTVLDVSWAPKELGPFFGATVSLREDDADVAFVHLSYDAGFFFFFASEIGRGTSGRGSPVWPVLRPKLGFRYDPSAENKVHVFIGGAAGLSWRLGRHGLMSIEYEHHFRYSDTEHSMILLRWYKFLGE